MTIQFPSLEFLQALQEAAAGEAVAGPDYNYFGMEVGDTPFVLELEDGTCVSVALGGNPNDLDFVIAGSDSVWREMLEFIAKNGGADEAHSLTALVEAEELDVHTMQSDGHERFLAAADAIQTLLDAAQELDLEFE